MKNETWYLISWANTSNFHVWPIVLFTGTKDACEKRRSASNFPQSLDIRQDIPDSY
jgi:hypothetical protein